MESDKENHADSSYRTPEKSFSSTLDAGDPPSTSRIQLDLAEDPLTDVEVALAREFPDLAEPLARFENCRVDGRDRSRHSGPTNGQTGASDGKCFRKFVARRTMWLTDPSRLFGASARQPRRWRRNCCRFWVPLAWVSPPSRGMWRRFARRSGKN